MTKHERIEIDDGRHWQAGWLTLIVGAHGTALYRIVSVERRALIVREPYWWERLWYWLKNKARTEEV